METPTRIVDVQLPNGAVIKVEASLIGEQKVGLLKQFSFEDVSKTLEAIATELQATIAKVKPKKSTVKFGIELGVESGELTALLVKGSGKANLEITLEWGG
jgi:hypothetical protein